MSISIKCSMYIHIDMYIDLSTYTSVYLTIYHLSSIIYGLVLYAVSGIHWESWKVCLTDKGKLIIRYCVLDRPNRWNRGPKSKHRSISV